MWVPKSEEDIVNIVGSGRLEETAVFDAKRELPSSNKEIAKDITAMSTDGGVILIGVDEDKNKRLTMLSPIPFAGEAERINAIVRSSISEPPPVTIRTYPTSSDPSKGFLAIIVPPSERSPHMVVVKGDHRYYGRSDKGNVLLTEPEVARLYERRKRWELAAEDLISQEIDNTRVSKSSDLAFLYLVAKPLASSNTLLDECRDNSETRKDLLNKLIGSACRQSFVKSVYSPDFYSPAIWTRKPDGFLGELGYSRGRGSSTEAATILNIQVDFDGAVHLFCGRAAQREHETLLFFPTLVAGITAKFLFLIAELYERGNYIGSVDTGLAITGLQDSVPYSEQSWRVDFKPYDQDEYRRSKRILTLFL